MPTYALKLAYDGSRFNGWQIQPNAPTIQGRLEECLATICREKIRLSGSGRTDSGVHALGQVASFSTATEVNLNRLQRGLNALAAPHISVINAWAVPRGFHARFSSIAKTYQYALHTRPHPPLLNRHQSWSVGTLNIVAMAKALHKLKGQHDFSAFRSAQCQAKSAVHTIIDTDIEQTNLPHADLLITIKATGFLQHMMRIIIGTLVAIGKGKSLSIESILASKKRSCAGITAPAQGLYLIEVHYDLEQLPQLSCS